MAYLVGDLLKKIEAGAPITSFPRSFIGPSNLEKEKEADALHAIQARAAIDAREAKAKAKAAREQHDEWVKKKWARCFEPNVMGNVKPNFDKMTIGQFEQYVIEAQYRSVYRIAEATTRVDIRDGLLPQQQKGYPHKRQPWNHRLRQTLNPLLVRDPA